MVFWGVELRPGSAYTHRYHPSDGRLRVTQAVLVNCDVATRTLVQCTVGNKMPLTICSLNPTLSDMCHLEVEFEEDVDVLFSVVGPSAVHISGYYLRNSISNRNIARDQPSSEYYEEDIGEFDSEYSSESEESNLSDFIDDGDVEASDSMDDGDVFFSHDHHRPAFEKHSLKVELQRRLERKHQADNSDDNIDEDEGFFPGSKEVERLRMLFPLSHKRYGKNVMSNHEIQKESNDVRKRKCDAINNDSADQTELTEVNGSSIPDSEHRKQKVSKKSPLEPEDGKHSNHIRTFEDGLIIEDLSAGNRDRKVASKGNKVYINYVGKLLDGKIVHSNAGETPYKFMLGAEKVIRGWDLGIIGMGVGDKRRLTIPPSLRGIGFGPVGKSSKYSTIIYEVELVEVC